MDNLFAPNFPDIDTVEENGPQRWFFEVDGEIPMELCDSVRHFFFPCINRTVPRDSFSPYNLSSVVMGACPRHL